TTRLLFSLMHIPPLNTTSFPYTTLFRSRQGIIQVDASKIDEDDLLGKALDAGATDMRRAEKAFEIITAPAEMDAVRDALNRARVPVLEGQVNFVPQSTVRVEGKDATSVVRLIEALEELDDVQSVYANYDI